MRTTDYNNHRLHADPSGSVSSHLLSLQCVLDKYQHENELLTHKIALLLQENKKLRHHSNNNRSYPQKIHDQHPRHNCDQIKNNFPQNNFTDLYPTGQGHNNHSMKTKSIKIPVSNSTNSVPLSKAIYEQLSEDQSKTERTKNIDKNQYDRFIKRERYFNEDIIYCQDVEAMIENENDKKTQRKGKQRTKTQQSSSPRQIIRIKKFTKEVYLEAQTFYDEPSSERLPTFVQPSFGYQESKQKCVFLNNCKKQDKQKELQSQQIKDYKIKKQNENIQKGYFRLQMSHRQKQEILREKEKFIQQKRKQEEEKSHLTDRNNLQIQIINGKKTNYPYKDTDFKLAEPKAMPTKVSQGREVREERDQEKRDKSNGKKNRSIVNKIARPTVLR